MTKFQQPRFVDNYPNFSSTPVTAGDNKRVFCDLPVEDRKGTKKGGERVAELVAAGKTTRAGKRIGRGPAVAAPTKAESKRAKASREGGLSVLDRYGKEFFAEIGSIGGLSLLDDRGPEYFAEIGRKGGLATAALIALGKGKIARDRKKAVDVFARS